MATKEIYLGDSSPVKHAVVDAQRYNAFDALCRNPVIGALANDSTEALSFLVSQLAYTESQAFERLYQPLQYQQLIPLDFSAGEWADSIRYEIYDYVGQGKRSSGKGRDINLVDIAYADKSWPVLNGNIGYDYTTEELRRTAHLGRPISDRKAFAARDAYERHMNQVGLYGEAISGITGLFNNASVTHASAPTGSWLTGGAGGGPQTPALILADINALIQLIWANTAYNDMPTDIIMPPSNFAYVASQPRSDNSDTTILSYIKANNIAKTERGMDITFSAGFGLETAGDSSTKRMMGYVKRSDRLVMHLPMPLRFLQPQLIGLSVQVPGEYKYSGVEIRYPKSAYYMDGM